MGGWGWAVLLSWEPQWLWVSSREQGAFSSHHLWGIAGWYGAPGTCFPSWRALQGGGAGCPHLGLMRREWLWLLELQARPL